MANWMPAGIKVLDAGGGNSGIGNGCIAAYPRLDAELAENEAGGDTVKIKVGAVGLLLDGITDPADYGGDMSDDFVRNRAEAIGYLAERYAPHDVTWGFIVPQALADKALSQTVDGYKKQITMGYSRYNDRTGNSAAPVFAGTAVVKDA